MSKNIDAPLSAPADLRLVTVDEVIGSLKEAIVAAGSQRAYCLAHGLFESEVSNVLHGRRPPNRAMMRSVGVSPALVQRARAVSDALMEETLAEAVRQAIQFNRWYPAAHDAAVEMWKAGVPGPEISAFMLDRYELRKTKSAVIGRMYRHGLAFQGPRSNAEPGARGKRSAGSGLPRSQMPPAALARVRERDAARDNERRRKRRAERTAVAPRAIERIPTMPKPPKRKPVEGDARIRESLRIPLWEIREGQCRFMASDPLIDSTMCSHRVEQGSAWCPGHHAVCTVGGRRRTATAYRSFNPAFTQIRRTA